MNGRTFYYLVESARVDGRPRTVSQRYLGSADDIAAALEGGGGPAPAPTRSRHLAFGDVAAVWGVLTDLGVARLVDEIVGTGRARVSVGSHLALAVLRQAVAPESDLDLATWWSTTAAARFVRPRIDPRALELRSFRRAMARLGPEHLRRIEAALFPRLLAELGQEEPGQEEPGQQEPGQQEPGRQEVDRQEPGPGRGVLVLDVPHFATYTGPNELTTGARMPTPATTDAWLAGLTTVVTLDGAIPLVSSLYRHGESGGTAFTALTGHLASRYRALSAQGPVTVVVDAGQSAQLDFGARAGLHFVASLPPGEHPDLLARPATGRRAVDLARFPGVTALDTRARVAGVERRVILLHSAALQAAQGQALAQDLGSTTRRLEELAAALARGGLHLSREQVAAEVGRITRFRWVERVLTTTVTGTEVSGLRLRWTVDQAARARLHHDLFGKQLLVTDHDDWPVADVLTAYRARYRLESTLRQFVGPVVAAPSPRWHWDEDRVAVHALVCLLATTVAHLMRRTAQRSGLDLSVRDLLGRLAGIEETHLTYPSTGGRPRTRRVLAERDDVQQRLYDLFRLSDHAPIARPRPRS
nr:transposase [Actinopolymorpha pittospori]